ncbi:MAG: helix-turn-helix transcriptional regulator [Spirochaetales bacterium]|nr:helix-turn-helix transcriptional regulator [Spirochaetales bacterium]
MPGEKVLNSVREKRMKLGITQEDLAGLVGVTRQTIIAVERGNYSPSVLLALRLAQHLRCPVEELFYEESV